MIQQGKNRLYIYLAVYFLLLFKAGFFFIERSNRITAPLLLGYLLIVAIVYNDARIKIDKNDIVVAILLLVFINMTNLLFGFPALHEYGNLIVNLVTALIIVSLISKEDFIKAYCDIILWIGIVSIIAWGAMTYFPPVFDVFPSLVNTANRIGYYCGLTIVSDFRGTGAQRTQGLFWEPGAYQCLVIVAMLLEQYYYSPPKKFLRMLVNSVAILLSFSTTGYIALILAWVIILSKKCGDFHVIRTVVIVLLIGYIYISFGSNLSGQLWYTLWFKIDGVLHYETATNHAIKARVGSFIEPLKLFFSNPMFGIGERGYDEVAKIVGLSTCTPINYICKYGIPFACINFYGFYRLMKTSGIRRFTELFFITLTLIVSFFSENFFMNPILMIFMLYGYKSIIKNRT